MVNHLRRNIEILALFFISFTILTLPLFITQKETNLTGRISKTLETKNEISVNQIFTKNETINFSISKILSVSITGKYNGEGTAKIFVKTKDNKIKVYETNQIKPKQTNLLTGFVTENITETNEQINETINETNLTLPSTTNESNITTAINKTNITLNVEINQTNTTNQTIINATNETNISNTINETIINETNQTINESINQTIEQTSEILEQGINETNETIVNETNQTINFINECGDACDLKEAEIESIIIELNKGELFLEKIIFTQSKEEVFKQIKNFPDFTINETTNISLTEYFEGEDLFFDASTSDGYDYKIIGTNLEITPKKTGEWTTTVYAVKNDLIISSNEFIINITNKTTEFILNETKIDQKILEELNRQQNVRVIIKTKQKLSTITISKQTAPLITGNVAKEGKNKLKIKDAEKRIKKLEKLSKKEKDDLEDKTLIDNAINVIEVKQELNEYQSVLIDASSLAELSQSVDVEKIILDEPFTLTTFDTINITKINEVTNSGYTGNGQSICVLDTGLNNDVTNIQNILGTNILSGTNNYSDDNGHGTKVTYPISQIATSSNYIIAKVIDENGTGYASDVIAGLEYCEQQNATIISLSIGAGNYNGYCDADITAQKVNEIVNNGTVVIAASGNTGNENIKSPACASNATPVIASTKSNTIASFSSRNGATLLAAPGENIQTKDNNGNDISVSGTSMSVPFVTGTTALILENRTLSPKNMKSLLVHTGDVINETNQATNTTTQYTQLNAWNALTNNITNNLTPFANQVNGSEDNFTTLTICDTGSNTTTCTITTAHTLNGAAETFNNLVINSGGSINHTAGTAGGTHIIVSGNLTIKSGGSINANAKGEAGSAGTGQGGDSTGYEFSGSGGGYGGGGGDGSAFSSPVVPGGITYDSATNVNSLGSGGGNGGTGTPVGGRGGGYINISVTGILNNSGTITANGETPAQETAWQRRGAGGGSGGGVNIETGIFTGTGTITVIGGNGGDVNLGTCGRGGGGGGGRIYISYSTYSYTGTNNTAGGTTTSTGCLGTNAQAGSSGTITLQESLGSSTLVSSCNTLSTANTIYNLTQNISSTTLDCITITAQNITLDCLEYSMTGNNTDEVRGVISNQPNTTIRNCLIMNYTTGIYLQSGADDSNITNNQIKDATAPNGATGENAGPEKNPEGGTGNTTYGLRAESSGNSISNNSFFNLRGGTGGTGGLGACCSYTGGIGGLGGDVFATYFSDSNNNDFFNNKIENITSGAGGAGGAGYLSAGGAGSTSGTAYGIYLTQSNSSSFLNVNITNITSGNGGVGGAGHNGFVSGVGGESNNSNGVYITNSKENNISNFQIKKIYSGNGGDGGVSSNSQGPGGDGGSAGDSLGINLQSTTTNLLIKNNIITNIYSGSGGTGGLGYNGVGGNGNAGGQSNGIIFSSSSSNNLSNNTINTMSAGNGGDGGDANFGNQAGDGGDGGDVKGTNFISNSDSCIINNNTISSLTRGLGGAGGTTSPEGNAGSNGTTYGEFFDSTSSSNLNYYNNFTSLVWISNADSTNNFNTTIDSKGVGNIYYFNDGSGSWDTFDITDTDSNDFADSGSDRPFNSANVGGNWSGSGGDYFPYAPSAVSLTVSTLVGSATSWIWDTAEGGSSVSSGTPYSWTWRTYEASSGRRIRNGTATNWTWINE